MLLAVLAPYILSEDNICTCRIVYLQISRFFQNCFCSAYKNSYSVLPFRYFNKFLVLYTDPSASRQIGLLGISSCCRGWSHSSLCFSGLFLHWRRLFFANHKDFAFGCFIMIHDMTLSRVSPSWKSFAELPKTRCRRHPHGNYLIFIPLSVAEKPFFTELVMFVSS